MKTLLAVGFFFTMNCALAEYLPRDYWYVVSDSAKKTVSSDVCLVTGTITEAFSQGFVEGGIVSNLDRSSNTKTDAKGNFSLTISIKDTAIFFFHKSYSEIVCWNYDFRGGHHVVMNFITSEKLPEGMEIMEEKPVIYAYSTSDLTATLQLANAADFTFTYPEYEDGWNIKMKSNELYVNENEYPYLFWEGISKALSFDRTEEGVFGFQIKTDSSVQFLERILSDLNFNSTEKTDFITYWGPRLEQTEFADIQFLVDENYDSVIGGLNCSPQADNQRRVFMIFKGADEFKFDPSFIEPTFTSFKREGFYLLEWGGAELPKKKSL